MRPRTLILLVAVIILVIVLAVILLARNSNGGLLSGILPGADNGAVEDTTAGDGDGVTAGVTSTPLPTATPTINFVPVVVAIEHIPVGERLRADLLATELRPDSNVALLGQYTFSEPEDLVGQIAKVEIAPGQEILRPMLALSPNDIANLGSDLSLYVDQGKVAVAFPIDKFSGIAYAVRPGDMVDVLMSLSLVEIDEDFGTELPNQLQYFDNFQGPPFLLDATQEGRLEIVEGLDLVALIVPGKPEGVETPVQVARRVTQLTIQQVRVLYVGTYRDPREFEEDEVAEEGDEAVDPSATATPIPERFEEQPDLLILSMSAQDALTLKFAQETGVEIDLALRAQGDETVFVTTSVSLPQIINQGFLIIPAEGDFALDPPVQDVPPPFVPQEPPG